MSSLADNGTANCGVAGARTRISSTDKATAIRYNINLLQSSTTLKALNPETNPLLRTPSPPTALLQRPLAQQDSSTASPRSASSSRRRENSKRVPLRYKHKPNFIPPKGPLWDGNVVKLIVQSKYIQAPRKIPLHIDLSLEFSFMAQHILKGIGAGRVPAHPHHTLCMPENRAGNPPWMTQFRILCHDGQSAEARVLVFEPEDMSLNFVMGRKLFAKVYGQKALERAYVPILQLDGLSAENPFGELKSSIPQGPHNYSHPGRVMWSNRPGNDTAAGDISSLEAAIGSQKFPNNTVSSHSSQPAFGAHSNQTSEYISDFTSTQSSQLYVDSNLKIPEAFSSSPYGYPPQHATTVNYGQNGQIHRDSPSFLGGEGQDAFCLWLGLDGGTVMSNAEVPASPSYIGLNHVSPGPIEPTTGSYGLGAGGGAQPPP